MDFLLSEPWFGVSVALAGLAGLQTARLWWREAGPRLVQRRRSARAQAGEEAASGLLGSLGYSVEGSQAETTWTVLLDGEPLPVTLRADYIVKRGGRRYVAEVKTGDSAPSLRTASTRRQLLEYRLGYDVDGVLLVDMEAGRVHSVEFPLPPGRPGILPRALPWGFALIVGVAAGACAVHVVHAVGARATSAPEAGPLP